MYEEGIFQNIQEATRNETVDVIASSGVVSEARNEHNFRKDLILRNTSPTIADIISLNIGFAIATAGEGVILRKDESISFSSETGYQCPNNVISAVCTTANGKLSIFER